MSQDPNRWIELAAKAKEEKDPKTLIAIVDELCQALEDGREETADVKPLSKAS